MTRRGNTIKIPRGYYTAAQIAQRVGVSIDTVKRWRKMGALRPARHMKAGSLTIPLFNVAGLQTAKILASKKTKIESRLDDADLAA